MAFVSEAVLCDQLLHRFYWIYSSLKVHGISTLFSFVFQVGKLRYQDVKWFAQASPLVRWGRARLHTHDLAVFPWPDGTSQATGATFLLFVMVPSPLGTPGSEVWIVFELLIPLPMMPQVKSQKSLMSIHLFHVRCRCPLQAFIFMKFLCPNGFIFLTIKLIHYRQPRIIKSRIKSSVFWNNH